MVAQHCVSCHDGTPGPARQRGEIVTRNTGLRRGRVPLPYIRPGNANGSYTLTNDATAPILLNVDIKRFWGWFRPGFVAVGFETDIETDIEVNNGSTTQTSNVSGHGENRGQVASDANWKLSLDRMVEDFLKNLDAALIGAGR